MHSLYYTTPRLVIKWDIAKQPAAWREADLETTLCSTDDARDLKNTNKQKKTQEHDTSVIGFKQHVLRFKTMDYAAITLINAQKCEPEVKKMAFAEWKHALNSPFHHPAETTPPPLFLV